MNNLYIVTLSKRQLQLIQTACEDFLRTRMGQFWNLTQDIALADVFDDGFGYAATKPSSEKIEAAERVLDCAYRLLDGPNKKKTHEMMIAEELFTQIRHYLYMERPESERSYWCTSSDEPLKLTDEPRIIIKRIKKEEKRNAENQS